MARFLLRPTVSCQRGGESPDAAQLEPSRRTRPDATPKHQTLFCGASLLFGARSRGRSSPPPTSSYGDTEARPRFQGVREARGTATARFGITPDDGRSNPKRTAHDEAASLTPPSQ
jgi:hypothetical protein